jgi:aldose 1-epimerase
MTERITIENDSVVLEVLPQLGGSVAAFDMKVDGQALPIFRRWTEQSQSPRTFACIPMVPYFARISGGGITWDGTFYPIERNDPEDEYPLHGDGWRSPWEVADHTPERIALRLRSRVVPPFDYTAELVYALAGPMLEVSLSIQHHGPRPVPYGMGLHPWFPRTPDVTLQSNASGTWLEQPPKLPTKSQPDPLPARWDFSAERRLPEEFVDNSFAGWDGHARITWPDAGYGVSIAADPAVHLSHVYAPDPEKPFFCFEQITNIIDAFNLPGSPAGTGLRGLATEEKTAMWVRYTAERL